MRGAVLLACLPWIAKAWGVPGAGRVLRVGPSQACRTANEAAAAAHDGDTIELEAGRYVGDVALWTANGLTIRAVGGDAEFIAAGRICQDKAIWVVHGDHTTIEHVAFSGCKAPDRNGAGIRQEGRGLTLRACRFSDNENGLLTGADPQSDLVLDHCDFAGNGAGDGQSHNLYVGRVRSLVMRRCTSHDARGGHLVKSRARLNFLFCNRFIDGDAGTSGNLIDLPDGGGSIVWGNYLEHGLRAQNRYANVYGEESASNPLQLLMLLDNVFVNRRPSGGDFVRAPGPSARVFSIDNLVIGASL